MGTNRLVNPISFFFCALFTKVKGNKRQEQTQDVSTECECVEFEFVFYLSRENQSLFSSRTSPRCSSNPQNVPQRIYLDRVVEVTLWPPYSVIHTYIHTYIRLLTTSPKGLFSANYKEKDKNKNIYKLFKVTNCKSLGYHSSLLNLSKSTPLSLLLKLLTSMHNLISLFKLFQMFTIL